MQFLKYCTQRKWNYKIVLAKSLICTYNSRSRNTPVNHMSCRKVLPASVPLHLPVLQTATEKCDTATLEGLRTKHTFNVIHVDFFVLDLWQ